MENTNEGEVSPSANIAVAITHAQRTHNTRQAMLLASFNEPDHKQFAERYIRYLIGHDIIVETCLGACTRAVVAGSLRQGWDARPMLDQGVTMNASASELIDNIEDLGHQIDLQSQTAGNKGMYEFDISGLFMQTQSQSEIGAHNQKAQKLIPGFDVMTVVFSEAENFCELIQLSRYYISAIQE